MIVPLFRVTKKHSRGLLKGLTTNEETTASFTTGTVVKKAIGGGGYEIIKCERIGTKNTKTNEVVYTTKP
jgi:hypothetical protein